MPQLSAGLLFCVFVWTQVQLWAGEGSVPAFRALDHEVMQKTAEVALLIERNQQLDAEVRDLKEQFEAVEERARAELGMVKQGEKFYFLLPDAL